MPESQYLDDLVIFVIAGTRTILNFATMPKEPIPKLVANAWSAPTKELSGRLRVEFEDLEPGLRHGIYMELRNHSLSPVAVINQPEIHAELYDSSGKLISTLGFSANGPSRDLQWAVIPRDAYISLRVDMQTVGVPTREQGVALIAVGGKSWRLGAGKYVLRTAVIFKEKENAPPNQWIGKLELPPVEVVVTTQMLMVN